VLWTVPLRRVKDHGLLISDIQSYGFDFAKENSHVYEATCIKITLKHPLMPLGEQSVFYQHIKKPMSYSLQFVSCFGSSRFPGEIESVIHEIQKDRSL